MENRIKRSSDYWFNVIWGGILAFGIIYLIGHLILMKAGLLLLDVYYLVFCVITVVFYQWKDDNMEVIKTELSKDQNFKLTENVLDKLNWNYERDSAEIKLKYNKYILKFLRVVIIPINEKIYFNFQYDSTTKTGRLPFYFGINTLIKWKFKRNLKIELNKKPNA
jgi:hypothetical protein